MEHVAYILYYSKFDKTYTGQTSSIISKLQSHNTFTTIGWTTRYRPRAVAHLEFFNTRKEAIVTEKWSKTGAGRRHKEKLIKVFQESS